ncbi:MAG: endonuclease/exonuclease/phosphatase family protein [Bdellovibrio sp.]
MSTPAKSGIFYRTFKIANQGYTGAINMGFVLGVALWALGCATTPPSQNNPLAGPAPEGRISIMAYNVENLFDELHDVNREDFTYLPVSTKMSSPEAKAHCMKQTGYRRVECEELNWDEAAVRKKIRHTSNSILQVYGRGPDVLILVEVENLRVLKRLNDEGLKDAGYSTVVLIEGDDMRGIDIGLLSRLPLAGEAKLHRVEFSPSKNPSRRPWGTRGVLQVPLKLPNGKTLYAFGLHFPSQANPVEERQDAMNTLTKAIKALPEGSAWVVGGDWNITETENEETGIFDQHIGAMGLVSHKVGCKSCKGTHNYRGVWDFLDILVFSPHLAKAETGFGYRLIPESIITPKSSDLQMQRSGRPARFSLTDEIGVSDHLPIYGELQETPKK